MILPLFNGPGCWSDNGLNPHPTAAQTSALPTELKGQWQPFMAGELKLMCR